MALKGTVYLLHFDSPIAHAQHYLGFAEELGPRLNAHRHGKGARLTQVAGQREIGFELVRTWEGTRSDERKLKNRKNAPKLCPYCNERPQAVAALVEIKL